MAEDFRIAIGGPWHRAERATHLDTLRRMIATVIGITWAPLIVIALVEVLLAHTSEPMLQDLSVHVRLLVTLPLLIVAEGLLDGRCRTSVARLFDEGFVAPEHHGAARAVLRSAERWRDSPLPEAILLVMGLAVGLASLAGILPPAGLMHGVATSRNSAMHIWYGLISLPIYQFVLWRSLFRWALWVRVLVGISRVPLRLLPMHADCRGGIGFLKRPSLAYGTVLLLAVSCALCGGWATQIILYGTKIDTLKPLFIAFVLVGTIIAFAPLLAFVPQLFAARMQGRNEYGGLVSDYARGIQKRWIEGRERADLLGSSDFQSLADIGNAYRDNVEKMQLLLPTPRDCILLFVVSQIPAIPIVLSQVPASEVLKRLLHLVAGGMPG